MILNESTIPDLLSRPVNIKWEEGAPAPVATVDHTVVLYNGAICIGGGTCSDGGDDHKIHIYHPDINKWDDAIDTPHEFFAMTVLMDKLIIVGGEIRGSRKVTNKLLTLQGGQWKDYSQMPTARYGASAVSHRSMMIVMGGEDDDHYYGLSVTELLDSTTSQWTKYNDFPQPLCWLQSVIVGSMLYRLGGVNANGYYSRAVYAAPLHNLSSHQLKWQQLADIPWCYSAAVSVNNKYLLAVGGRAVDDTMCVLTIKKAGSLITTSWKSIGTLPKVHKATSAVSLGNQIIVIGSGNEEGDNHKTVTIGTFW